MSLDQVTANFRASVIRKDSISYNFNLIFQDPKLYYGLAQITFYLEHVNFTELKLDFQGKILEDVIANSKRFMPKTTENFILLPKEYLQKGRNRVSVMYTNGFDNDRIGCITFQDNDSQYIYTDFEPYGANRVFPCFDQPNLKARMRISIVTDIFWNAISNQPPNESNFTKQQFKAKSQFHHQGSHELLDAFLAKTKSEENQQKMTMFDYTELLPTYVYSFAVGPYLFLSDSYDNGRIPMRLYCISSVNFMLSSYSDFIFDVTKKAMAFFQDFFGMPFPFKKYDQIWVRDYSNWAMENAGLVTYNQEKMLQPYSTQDNYYDFANTLVHQLSHHWFGNFVTMDWWDDLWLNQSFADFIAHFVLDKINDSLITPLEPSYMYFRDRKSWGYEEDQRDNGTHAIRGPVPDTDVALNNFDGITYSKGAALIKQLVFMLGQTGFQSGLKSYFNRFRWSNATIYDFLDDMQPYFPSNINITTWMESWLQTPSLNVFESIWNPTDFSSNATLTLKQSPFSQKYNTLRWHKMQIAFFNSTGTIVMTKTVTISPDNPITTITYDGSYAVKAILLNYNDHTFMQNFLDTQSLQFFMNNIETITDIFTRSLVWYNIAKMVKHSFLKLEDYTVFLQDKLINEPVEFIVNQLLDELIVFMDQYLPADEVGYQSDILFATIYNKLQDMSIVDYDRITILQKFYIKFAQTDSHILQLKKWLMKEDPTISARQIKDETLPWNIVKKIFSVSDSVISPADKQAAYQFNYELDKSSRADQTRIVIDTIACSKTQFDDIYQKFKNDDINLTQRLLLAEGWRNKFHAEWILEYRQKYFADLITLSDTLPFAFYQIFYTNLRPLDMDYSYQIAQYNLVIDALKDDPEKAAHVENMRKIVDDLTLYQRNKTFNADSNKTLSQERAIDRWNWIRGGSVSYTVHIGFISLKNTRSYTGLTQISFQLTKIPNLLHIDFRTNQIYSMVINGNTVTPWLVGQYLLIPRNLLVLGVNNVGVHYTSEMDNDGLGLCSYIDESGATDKYYTYTQFEPHSAHRMFPCFDQPDLKARMELGVIFPDTTWTAASNQTVFYTGGFSAAAYTARVPTSTSKLLPNYLVGKVGRFTVFNRTQVLPTYLFVLAAGQYAKVVATAGQLYNNIPMTVYALDSYKTQLAKYADFFFQFTKLAIQFYSNKLGIEYPFTKYDSIFCHQYSAGAMQHPGLVTFTDNYLFEADKSLQRMVAVAGVICHQAAHHWFGDNVTMKWWDDLWLNQSFADYMSYYCMENIRTSVTTIANYDSGWFAGTIRAAGGFRQDSYTETTHPIRPKVVNTSVNKEFFDGITYNKGFMVLKHLNFLIGDGNFFNGVKSYLNTFSFANATIDDFVTSMTPYFKPNPTIPNYTIQDWRDTYLLTPSMNVLEVVWDPSITIGDAELTIVQTPYDQKYPTLRYHKIVITYIKQNGTYNNATVTVNNQTETKVTYTAGNNYKAILLNSDMNAFVKCVIDTDSYNFLKDNMTIITNGNQVAAGIKRMTLWTYMNEMVRDRRIKASVYKDIILNSIANQRYDVIYQNQLNFLSQCIGYMATAGSSASTQAFDFVLNQLTTITQNKREVKQPKRGMKEWLRPINPLKMFKSEEDSQLRDTPNRKMILADYLPVFAATLTHIDTLEQWRKGTYAPLATYPINVYQAFSVVRLVYSSSRYDSAERLNIYNDQFTKTPGGTGILTKNTVTALDITDMNDFETVYQSFRDMEESLDIKASWASGWNSGVHISWLQNTYKPRYFQDIPILSRILTSEHFKAFYSYLTPIDSDYDGNIALFQAVELRQPQMLGHIHNIQKIIEGIKFTQKLKAYNP